MSLLLALLLFPGLLLALLAGVALALLAGDLPRGLGSARPRGRDGAIGAISIALAGLSLGLAPWPLHPAAGSAPVGSLALIWALAEAAAIVPLGAGLLSRTPLAVRGAAREAQLGVAGRAVLWLAVAAALALGDDMAALPGRLLALVAGLLALPAAAGLGPWRGEGSLAPGGAEHGLDEGARPLLRLARYVRAAALLGTLAAASAYPTALLGGPGGLAVALALLVGGGLALRRMRDLPQLTLPAGLRWCWQRALPVALAAALYSVMR